MNNLLRHGENDRSWPLVWGLRAFGLLLTVITLGVTANNAANFSAYSCSIPGKLSYNLAVTVISFFVLLYTLFATGPSRIFKTLPWIVFGQIALDAVLLIFWLAATATSVYSCDDVCNACDGDFFYGTLYCTCDDIIFFKEKRSTSSNPANILLGKRRSRTSSSSGRASTSTANGSATTALDSLMTALFAFFLAATLFWFLQSRRSTRRTTMTNATAMPPVAGEPIKHEEAGMGAPTSSPMYPPTGDSNMQYQQQQQPPYGGQPTMQQQPPYANQQQQQQQQQPTMHQVPYNPTMSGEQPPYQKTPEMTHQAHPMTDHYGPQQYTTTPPPQTGTVEMPHAGEQTMQGTHAPQVHQQTP